MSTTDFRTDISNRLKAQIELLRDEKGEGMSQRKWADRHGISNATVSNILKGKWQSIGDGMWRKVAAALGAKASEWTLAPTRDYKLINGWLSNAQMRGMTMAVTAEAGSGKTETIKHYAATHPNVAFLQCAGYWTQIHFLRTMYRQLGKNPGTLTRVELAEGIIATLRQQKHPLVILDELDKLSEPMLMFLIELYNKLDGVCGFFYSGAPPLKEQIERGIARNKRGYSEIYSRMGGSFLKLNGANKNDVALICQANGVVDAEAISGIWEDVQDRRDMRRVKRLVDAKNAQASATLFANAD